MQLKPFITLFLVFALVTMACGFTINLPDTQVKTGPTVTEEVSVPAPDASGPIDLGLEFGAGKLNLNPGSSSALVEGIFKYNVADFKPTTTVEGSNVKIEQGNLSFDGIPSLNDKVINEWNLTLSEQKELNLKIDAGAYSGRYDFGGLSLKRLEVSDGASDVNLDFSQANPVELDVFNYTTGASSVTLEHLANANLVTMTFRSGAGSYRLDFTGELQRDAEVMIESGVSSIVVVVPEGVPAEVVFEGGISNVSTFGAWEKSGNNYSQPGEGPKIQITVKMGAGNLELRNR